MKVVGVKLNENGKVYYFDAADVNTHENATVIVETEKGLQYGIVVKNIPESEVSKDVDYKKVIRLTTKSDYKKHLSNLKDADKAIVKCNELIEQYGLDMKYPKDVLERSPYLQVVDAHRFHYMPKTYWCYKNISRQTFEKIYRLIHRK